MNAKYEKAINILKMNNQEHIIDYLENSNEERKCLLIEQILNINFEEINKILDRINSRKEQKKLDITPLNVLDVNNINEEKKEELSRIGEEIINKNKVAAVTLAGGQGTRLRT